VGEQAGGIEAGYHAGWLNLIGLVAILASVVYGAAIHASTLIGLLSESYAAGFLGGNYLYQQFFWFLVLMVVVTAVNIFCCMTSCSRMLSTTVGATRAPPTWRAEPWSLTLEV
jgi:uncharacterized membrane protein